MPADARELIIDFLTATRDLTLEETARIAGVRERVVESWRVTPRKQLRLSTRDRITAFLEQSCSAV